MTKSATIQDVFEAVQALATHMDERFLQVDKRFEQVDRRFENIDRRFDKIEDEMAQQRKEWRAEIALSEKASEGQFTSLHSRCGHMERFMVKVAKKLDMDYQAS